MNAAEVVALKSEAFHEPSVRLYADGLPLIIWSCGADGVCDFINRQGLDYTGLPAPPPDLTWLDLTPPDDRARLAAGWQSALRSGNAWQATVRLRRRDGVYRWFALQSVALADKWLISGSDVQETVNRSSLQVASDQELRGVFDEAPLAISLEDWRAVGKAVRALSKAGVDDLRSYINDHPEFVDQMMDATSLVDTNKVSLKLFRVEHHTQILGKSLRWMFASSSARQEFIELIVRFGNASPRGAVAIEMDMCAFDGTALRVLSSVRDRQPGIEPGMVLVSRFDVTESRGKDARLAEQSVLLDRTSSLAKVGGWVFDVANHRGTWTRQMSIIHGVEPGEDVLVQDSITDDWLTVFGPAERELLIRSMQRVAEHAEPYDLELPMVTPDQQHKWIRSRALPIVRDGKVVRIEGAVQDITDRKLAEMEVINLNATLEGQVKERTDQLERARRDLQNILDALPTLVAYWDRDLRLQFTNRAYQEMMGMTAEELKGVHFTELIDPAVRAQRLQYVQRALSGEPQHFEAVINRPPTGPPIGRAEIHYQPDIVGGEVRGIYVLVVDVTKQYQVADALRAANQELEAFAYAVAHDLRAPLRAMNGFSTALLEDCGPRLDDEARHFASEINRASCRMGDLLDGLLSLSRATQGDMRFDRIDISALAQSLIDELHQLEPQRQVHWQIAPCMIAYGDARMVEVALRNLLSNAWKYTGRKAPAEISFDTLDRNGQRHFRVKDNGAGFDMAHAERLFKPFQRLHRQDEFAGIGIGLATVNRIVKRHGGEIIAEATLGGGASFIFSLSGPISEHSS